MSAAKSVECKLCGARYKVAAAAESRRLTCKKCGRSMFIPGSRRTRRTPGGAVPSGVPTRRRRSAAPLVALTIVILAVAGVVVFLV